MKYIVLILFAVLFENSQAQPPAESPSVEPTPNVNTSKEMPKKEKEKSKSAKKIGPGNSLPDNPNYKNEPSSKMNQTPNPLDAPKDTVKPGTVYIPKNK